MNQKKKERDTSFSKTWKVIDQHGLEKINAIWREYGMFRTAEMLDTSPYTIRYIAHKYEWRRPAEKCPAILKGVLNGNAEAEFYRTLDFSGINLNNNKRRNNDS